MERGGNSTENGKDWQEQVLKDTWTITRGKRPRNWREVGRPMGVGWDGRKRQKTVPEQQLNFFLKELQKIQTNS